MKQRKELTEKQLEYLRSKGWSEHSDKTSSGREYTLWIHPKWAPAERGGYLDPNSAWNVQEEQDAYAEGKCFYYLISDNHGGFGYTIYEDSKEGKRRLVFNHHDLKVAESTLKNLKQLGRCEAVILDTSFNYNNVLILKEKHGNRMFYVSNLPSLFKTCRNIVMERIKDGYWYPTKKDIEKDTDYQKPSMTKEDIEKLKDGPVKKAALEEWSHYEHYLKYKKSKLAQIEDIEFIKKNDDLLGGKRAYLLLKERNGAEYEGFSLEEMEVVS